MKPHLLKSVPTALMAAMALSLSGQALAEGSPTFDASYSNRPKAWYDKVSVSDYFNPSITRSWQLNEYCTEAPGTLSLATYNIFHNVPFVTDFGDEMEQSLGKVVKCADVVLFQEAWDYDDIIEDGPRADMAARGFHMVTPSGYYCDDPADGAIENDCSGLVLFYKSSLTLVKELGFSAFGTVNGPDVHKEKGVWGVILAKGGKYYYVFNTHFTYGDNSHMDGHATSDASRVSNMQQSLAFIRDLVNANRGSYPPASVLLAGDFNADFDSINPSNKGYQLLIQASAQGAFYDAWDYRNTLGASMGAYETGGFKSNWVDSSVDTGPNGMASGVTGDFDTVLVGKPSYFNTCPATSVSYSGWAPRWNTLDTGTRKWPFYTHSDHYGRWLRLTPGC